MYILKVPLFHSKIMYWHALSLSTDKPNERGACVLEFIATAKTVIKLTKTIMFRPNLLFALTENNKNYFW